MPLYKTITASGNTKVLIWKIEEPETELGNRILLTKSCKERLASMKSEIHRRGFLSVRQLLKVAGYEAADLFYDENGKPHLRDGKKISITHSFIFSAVVISDIEVGIDIEKQRDKIQRIAKKFVDYEWSFLTEQHLTRELTVVWCIKESLYKVFATPGMSFKQHTKIIPFSLEKGQTVSWIHYEEHVQKHEAFFLEFDGFTCAYTLSLDDACLPAGRDEG
ncbi:4'-phosphopantetheinyl transferase superfamily protein [Sungkyunkwania multivorans]|uniref:4'-phosphopantetheinyl transferase superfamily protein n=1 Tax=Sungkyunkwania multivorans TaxID=1173618 RepID=A0ABW3D095_9FLAO